MLSLFFPKVTLCSILYIFSNPYSAVRLSTVMAVMDAMVAGAVLAAATAVLVSMLLDRTSDLPLRAFTKVKLADWRDICMSV